MMVTDNKYVKHTIFQELENYIDFYDSISMSVLSFPAMGTNAICNMDTYVYSSIKGTVASINEILIKGRINDAYALLRKYHDSVIINIYSNLYLQDNFNLENFVVDKINNWLHGKEKLPEYRIMSQYIRASKKLEDINNCLYSDELYKKIRDRCNDHTHYNFFNNVLLNDSDIYLRDRLQALNEFSKDIKNIFILHISYVLYMNDHYMMSSDYIDNLDCGMTPEEDSQYWVAPYVQKMFDEIIKKERNDLAGIIKNKSCMQLA